MGFHKKIGRQSNLASIRKGQFVAPQRGAAALIATVILVVIGLLSVLVVNKSALSEQKRSGADLRSKEVYAAANGMLEYGVSRLLTLYNDNDLATPVWSGGATAGEAVGGAVATELFDPDGDGTTNTLTQGIDAYGLVPSITYTLLSAEGENPAIIEISAPVAGIDEDHITKTVSIRVLRARFGTPSSFNGPALVVEECIEAGAVTGTPDIKADGMAIATINGDSSGNACIDAGNFNIEGGGMIGEPLSDDGGLSLFETMFGMDSDSGEAQLQELASTNANIYFVTETTPWGGASTTYGSKDSPVIVYFDDSSDCPAINGGVTVWGKVYYQAPEGSDGCEDPGGGDATIFGTLAFEGNLKQFNANTELVEVDFTSSGGALGTAQVITPIPGSWRDFAPAGL